MALAVSGIPVTAFSSTPLVDVDFESGPVGVCTPDRIHDDWGNVTWVELHNRARVVQEREGEHGKVLEIAYPKGAVGPADGGGQFVVRLPASGDMWLSYDVKFAKGFDFRLGGKLPGLTSGGAKYTGGNKPEDGQGWSARFMWREGGRAVVYFYHVGMSEKWGDDLPLGDAVFTPGKWHRIVQHIKVNTEDRANGVLQVWLDGRNVLSRSDIRFRIGNSGLIDSLYFSTFHGGNTEDWAPERDSFAYFDNFVASRNRCGASASGKPSDTSTVDGA